MVTKKQHMSYSLGNKLVFTDNFLFFSFPLNDLVMNLRENDFKYTSQEIDNVLLDLVKHKRILSLCING